MVKQFIGPMTGIIPPIINYDPPIELNKGQSIKLTATYNNNTNKTVRFGFKSTDEMMILFGWFYK